MYTTNRKVDFHQSSSEFWSHFDFRVRANLELETVCFTYKVKSLSMCHQL